MRFPEPEEALRWVEWLGCIGCIIAGAEAWYRLRRPEPPLTTWEVMQTRHPLLGAGRWKRIFGAVANDRSLRFVYGLRVVAALALAAVPLPDPVRSILAGFVAATILVAAIRCPYGLDGADQMLFIALIACALGRLGGEAARVAALLFVAGQAALSYLIAGVAKAISRDWRQGRALPGLLATEIYGNTPLARWLDLNPGAARLACWVVIVWETGFVLSFAGPPSWFLGFLAGGVLFHLACAVLMHLNTFLWAFPAAYPALWFAYGLLHRSAGSG